MKKRWIFLSGALICFAFIALTVFHSMTSGNPIQFDIVVRNFFLGIRNEYLTTILTVITYLGNSNTIVMMCIVLLIIKKTRLQYGFPLAITASCSATIQTIIKILVERPRPPVENFLIVQGGFSFPSGHSCSGLVFYGLFAYLLFHSNVDKIVHKCLGAACIVLFLIIGISRIYLGVHYPTDVLAGWCLGVAILVISITTIEKLERNKLQKRSGL